MTRTMLHDALSALAAATLASAAPGFSASAQGKSIKVYHAVVAMDAVRGPKRNTPDSLDTEKQATPKGVAQDAMSLAGPVPRRTTTGQDWRWWQDYGGGRHSQPSVQKELSLSDDL